MIYEKAQTTVPCCFPHSGCFFSPDIVYCVYKKAKEGAAMEYHVRYAMHLKHQSIG